MPANLPTKILRFKPGQNPDKQNKSCDMCMGKKSNCNGALPQCFQCIKAGSECRYTIIVEKGCIANPEREEMRGLADLFPQEEMKNDMLSTMAVETPSLLSQEENFVSDREDNRSLPKGRSPDPRELLRVYTFGIQRQSQDVATGSTPGASSKPKQQEGISTISQWIQDAHILATKGTGPPSISLLVIDTPDDEVFDGVDILARHFYEDIRALTEPILETLHLPSHVIGTFGQLIVGKSYLDISQTKPAETDPANSFIHHIAVGTCSLAFRFFPSSNSCIGVLLVQDYKEFAADVLKELVSHQQLIGHPLLLPLLAQRSVTMLVTSWLHSYEEVLFDAQAQTGYHNNMAMKKSSRPVDYTELSTKITGTAVNLATNEFYWQVLAEHADSMFQEFKHELETFESAEQSRKERTAILYLQAQTKRMSRNAHYKLHEAESWQKKASILIQGIFNLIAQQDQNTSIGIARDSKILAEESKRDSTSMKTLAVVTMTFLPGTFAASLFSMSMFQWDAESGSEVVSHRFWIYWLVTIPLTLATFLLWLGWIRYKAR